MTRTVRLTIRLAPLTTTEGHPEQIPKSHVSTQLALLVQGFPSKEPPEQTRAPVQIPLHSAVGVVQDREVFDLQNWHSELARQETDVRLEQVLGPVITAKEASSLPNLPQASSGA